MQREGEREITLMELPDFQKSQTHGHCTWQIDYAAHKTWCWRIPDTLDFLNRPWMVTLDMHSPARAPECGGIMCIVLADVWRLFQRMLPKGAESQVVCSAEICFSCAVYSRVEFCQNPSQSLGAITYFLQFASNIVLLQISYCLKYQSSIRS